jgi:amino acid adenylation domain-containing protein
VEYAAGQTIPALFEAQVQRTPDSVAVIFGDQQLTYRELDQSANRMAHYLQKCGVRPETIVGICLERSLGMMTALLGILKAGGTYLPLDPTYPKERLVTMLEDSKAPVLVTQRHLLHGLPRRGRHVVYLDSEWQLISREDSAKPPIATSAEHLAYVIYTSGSTGQPKGVQIPHRAVVNFLNSMRHQPGLSERDILLAVTTLSFDIAGLELFLPLSVGARVVLASREEAADGVQLAARMVSAGVTVMQATPATWRLLLDSGWQGNRKIKLLCGGEALTREMANRLLDRCDTLWNLYGPTETTIWSTVARVEPGNGPVSVGRPIANTQIYILDRNLQPVPVGVSGELFIGGDGVARGYLHRPTLTAEKFVSNPFTGAPEAHLYRTGDRARWLPDGNIELLGRVDHQVKIRGFRVELGEIETVLQQFPSVRECVVVAREGASGDRRLVAYLTTYRQITVSLNELRRFLRDKLPEYMVPSAFVTLDKLPLTPNGKVDRRALPEPEPQRPKLESAFAAPCDGLEQSIAAIWEQVLSIGKPGANDNFFDLGGHSLQVVQVQSRLREKLGIDLPVIKLFEHPTIRSLAHFLGDAKQEPSLSSKIQERSLKRKAGAARHREWRMKVRA